MISMRKALFGTALATLAPIAPLLSGSSSEVEASHRRPRISANIAIGGPVSVLGFSYGDPFVYGHVHYEPVHCNVGPLYYYPDHQVYAHYYPRHRYYKYDRPRYYNARHSHYHGSGHPGYARVRGHRYDRYERRYDRYRDDDYGDRRYRRHRHGRDCHHDHDDD